MTYCRSCQQPIEFVKLRHTGRLNPVNVSSFSEYRMVFRVTAGAGKRLILITEPGDVVSGYYAGPTVDPADVRVVSGWTSHFATCPDREQWQKDANFRRSR